MGKVHWQFLWRLIKSACIEKAFLSSCYGTGVNLIYIMKNIWFWLVNKRRETRGRIPQRSRDLSQRLFHVNTCKLKPLLFWCRSKSATTMDAAINCIWSDRKIDLLAYVKGRKVCKLQIRPCRSWHLCRNSHNKKKYNCPACTHLVTANKCNHNYF